jgi:hypothetical protein
MSKTIYLKVEYDDPEQIARLNNDALFRSDVFVWACKVKDGKIITDDMHYIDNNGSIREVKQ